MSDTMALVVVQAPRQSINIPHDVLKQVVGLLDPVSATCCALASKKFMDAWIAEDCHSKNVRRAQKIKNGEAEPAVIEYSTSASNFNPPIFGINLNEKHYDGGSGNEFVLKNLLTSWLPQGLVFDPFAVMFIGPETLEARIEECKSAIEDKQDELDSERETRREEREEEKEERQQDRAERKKYVMDHKEQEYLWMEQPLSDNGDEEGSNEEGDGEEADGEEDGGEEDGGEEDGGEGDGGEGDGGEGDGGEVREVPELTRDDEEYWVGLKGSMFTAERRDALIDEVSSTESSDGTYSSEEEDAFDFFTEEERDFMIEHGYPWA